MTKIFFFLLCFVVIRTLSVAQTYKYDSLGRIKQVNYSNGTVVYLKSDADGNRNANTFVSSTICTGATASLLAEPFNPMNTYQWQVDTGSGFSNIMNDTIYSGTATNMLRISNPPTSWYGYKYRCLISGTSGQTQSNEDTLKFVAVWYGGKDESWENPLNWGCNKVPDGNTDVIIYGNILYHPVVRSNSSVRSLTGYSKANLTVADGYLFTILH